VLEPTPQYLPKFKAEAVRLVHFGQVHPQMLRGKLRGENKVLKQERDLL